MKQIVKLLFSRLITKLSRIKFFRYFFYEITSVIANYTSQVSCRGVKLNFTVPNQLTYFRMKTIEDKEPETIDWIDSFEEGSCFYDIGANIGVFTLYAAKANNCKVFSFEPSVFNLEFLVRNININYLDKQVTIIPTPLYDETGLVFFSTSTLEWGGAFASLAVDDFDLDSVGYNISVTTLDDFIEIHGAPTPDYIKIDVDGVEGFILQGGIKTLAKVKGLLIEVDDNKIAEKDKIETLLKQLGFDLEIKIHSAMVEDSDYLNVYNQIWTKN